jgi:hypothetical protein
MNEKTEDVEKVLANDAFILCPHCQGVWSYAATVGYTPAHDHPGELVVEPDFSKPYLKATVCPICLGLQRIVPPDLLTSRKRLGMPYIAYRPLTMAPIHFTTISENWDHIRKFADQALETPPSEIFVLVISFIATEIEIEPGTPKTALVGLGKLLLPASQSHKWPPASRTTYG